MQSTFLSQLCLFRSCRKRRSESTQERSRMTSNRLTYYRLDEKTLYFKPGFDTLALQVRERYFTSVQDFSHQLSLTIAKRMSPNEDVEGDIDTIRTQLNDSRGTAEHLALSVEQKEVKKLAKRILRAVKEPLEDALKKEADLKGKELEEEIRKLDAMGIFAAAKALDVGESPVKANSKRRAASDASAAAGASPPDEDVDMLDADERTAEAVIQLQIPGTNETVPIPNNKKIRRPASGRASSTSTSGGPITRHNSSNGNPPTEPLSPPLSADSVPLASPDPSDVFASGGIPWYLAPFDPDGTTIHEERYTGREVMRAMSEELSDMDEDTLTELAVNGVGDTPTSKKPATRASLAAEVHTAAGHDQKKKAKKRAKSNQWSRTRRHR